jgi:hypothetical protein
LHFPLAAASDGDRYSLPSSVRALEGGQHPDGNAQFEYAHTQFKTFPEPGLPVISIDIKKKELVGSYKNSSQK